MPRPYLRIPLVAALVVMGLVDQARADAVQAAFSPSGRARDLVLQVIESARLEIDVAAYSFTSAYVADALIAAQRRGVAVRVVADESENAGKGYSRIYVLRKAGVPVRLDGRYQAQHNKFLVADGKTVQTGSFNYTASAERRNAENVIVIENVAVANQYRSEFFRLWNESQEVN